MFELQDNSTVCEDVELEQEAGLMRSLFKASIRSTCVLAIQVRLRSLLNLLYRSLRKQALSEHSRFDFE